jgi:hypothetical protein
MITKHAGGSALRWMAHSLSPILAAVSAVKLSSEARSPV